MSRLAIRVHGAMLLFLLSAAALAHSVPKPKFIDIDGRYNNGYPERRYHQVLDVVEDHFAPIVTARGGTLEFQRDFSDGAVNMWAFRWGDRYILEIPGGMARYHLLNEPGFLLSVCHELGHLLGGDPRRGNISFEGQSDYFATRDCITAILAKIAPYKKLVPLNARQKEIRQHCGANDQSICSRVLLGALALTAYYAELEQRTAPLLSTPDRSEADETTQRHPESQCRLDTFRAGLFAQPRPRCWYKPSSGVPKR